MVPDAGEEVVGGLSDVLSGFDTDGNSLFDAARQADPHRYLAEQRARGPVQAFMPGISEVVSRAGCEAVLRNYRTFSSEGEPIGRASRPILPIQADPPRHHDLRKLLDPIFAPKVINAMVAPVTALVNEHIDAVIDRGECVFDEEIAVPFPSQVFLTVAGLPVGDVAHLLRLKDGIMRPGYREGLAPEDLEGRNRINDATVAEIYDYFQAAVDDRRRAPAEDMMTLLTEAEVDGDRLSDEDILDICFLFLIAGLDTVTDSLTLFFANLAQHPERRRQIVENPGIIPTAVEELLRYESPAPMVFRTSTEDTEVDGCPVSRGTLLMVNLASANTDPGFLADADTVVLDREVNPHYAFGGGVHRCLGSHLARQELRIVLREWHRRIPEYRLKAGTELVWPPGLRSVENVVLEWDY